MAKNESPCEYYEGCTTLNQSLKDAIEKQFCFSGNYEACPGWQRKKEEEANPSEKDGNLENECQTDSIFS